MIVTDLELLNEPVILFLYSCTEKEVFDKRQYFSNLVFFGYIFLNAYLWNIVLQVAE